MNVVVQIVSQKQDVQRFRLKRPLTKADAGKMDVLVNADSGEDAKTILFAKQGFYSMEVFYQGTTMDVVQLFLERTHNQEISSTAQKLILKTGSCWWGLGRLYITRDELSTRVFFDHFEADTLLSDFYMVLKYEDHHHTV